jgi:hypothetical protein
MLNDLTTGTLTFWGLSLVRSQNCFPIFITHRATGDLLLSLKSGIQSYIAPSRTFSRPQSSCHFSRKSIYICQTPMMQINIERQLWFVTQWRGGRLPFRMQELHRNHGMPTARQPVYIISLKRLISGD